MRKHKGFTLIELMIVFAILGILLSIIVPACTSGDLTGPKDEKQAQKYKAV